MDSKAAASAPHLDKRTWRLIEAGVVLLFTFQAIRVLLAILFARVYDAVFDGEDVLTLVVTASLVVIALVMPAFSPRQRSRIQSSLRIAAVLCALARVPLSIDILVIRTLSATATLGFAGLYVAGVLRTRASVLGQAISLGLIADQLLRAMGHTYDIGLRPWWGFVQIALSIGVIVLAEWLLRTDSAETEADAGGFWTGVAFGSALFALGSLLALPNAAARWTRTSYHGMVGLSLALSTIPLWSRLYRALEGRGCFGARWLRVLAVFVGVSGLIIADRRSGAGALVGLFGALLVFWLLLPLGLSGGRRGTRLGLVLGMIAFLLLSTMHALSFTYAYVSPIFRGAALPAFMAAYLLSVGPAALTKHPRVSHESPYADRPQRFGLALAASACLLGLLVALPPRLDLERTRDAVRLGTYNIHYGFDSHWRLSLEEQAHTIEQSGADVVALQEVDAGRLTSYGIDNALWLGRRLGMRAVYLPTVEHLTGVALLSRQEVLGTGGTLLPSEAEPTGIVWASINVGGAPVPVYGLWFGLSPEERERQLRAAVEFVGTGRAVVGGDMNATPDSPIYAAMHLVGFRDPFLDLGQEAPPTDPSISPRKRIDYVWLRGLRPLDARVIESQASDHLMVIVTAE